MIELQFNPRMYYFFLVKHALFSNNLEMLRKDAVYQLKKRYFRRNKNFVNETIA